MAQPELVLEKSFDMTFDLIKGASVSPQGDRLFYGAAALVDSEDLDREIMLKAAVNNGLTSFFRMGGQVDYDHLYATPGTPYFHSPAAIIGRAIEKSVNPDGGADIITTKLKSANAFANAAWEHYHDPGSPGMLGYSLQGRALARDPLNKSAVTMLDIYMMTITPIAKGFEGPRLTAGAAPAFGQLLKGLNLELGRGDADGWKEVDLGHAATETFYSFPNKVSVEKAITTGSGVVMPGDSGGRALRTQYLQPKLAQSAATDTDLDDDCSGDMTDEEKSECRKRKAAEAKKSQGNKNQEKKTTGVGVEKSAAASLSPLERALSGQLTRLGYSNSEQVAQAIASRIK